MKDITIKLISNYLRNKVFIYDEDNLVYENIIVNNNIFTFCGKLNKLYMLKVINGSCIYKKNFVISNSYNEPYVFIFDSNRHLITIYLYDANYGNLQIEKGVINLWQNHTQ